MSKKIKKFFMRIHSKVLLIIASIVIINKKYTCLLECLDYDGLTYVIKIKIINKSDMPSEFHEDNWNTTNYKKLNNKTIQDMINKEDNKDV